MSPLESWVASPVSSTISPAWPLVDVPVLMKMDPLRPLSPAFTVLMWMSPELVESDAPDQMKTLPPVFRVVLPATMFTEPPTTASRPEDLPP